MVSRDWKLACKGYFVEAPKSIAVLLQNNSPPLRTAYNREMTNHKIKLFSEAQSYCNSIGFFASPLQPNQRCRLNAKSLYYFCMLALPAILVLCFLIFKAQSVYEYGISAYAFITLTMLAIFHVIIVYEMGNMLMLVEKYEEIIENRKYAIPNSTFR